MLQFGVFLSFISLSLFLWGQGCRVDQNQRLSGEARATVVVSYPAAEACFVSEYVSSFDQLKVCLELTTGQRFTLNADGEIIEAVVPPGN